MSAHTLGPWSWSANPSGGARVQTSSVGIADVLSRAGVAHPTQESCEANARLIAAAPELLAACEAALVIIGDRNANPWWGDTEAKLRAAIAKVRGGK